MLALLALLMVGTLQAQRRKKLHVEWAKPVPSNVFTNVNHMGIGNGRYYFVDQNFKVLGKGQVDLHAIDVDRPTKMVSETISDKKDGKIKQASFGGFCLDNQAFIYQSTYDKGEKELSLSVQPIDEDLKPDGRSFKLNTLHKSKQNDIITSLTNWSPNGEYFVIYSSSVKTFNFSDYLRIYPVIGWVANVFPRALKFYRRPHAVSVLNNEGDVVWSKEFFMGTKKAKHEIMEVNVNDEGKVIMFGNISSANMATQSIESAYNYSKKYDYVYHISKNMDEPKVNVIKWPSEYSVNTVYYTIKGDDLYSAASVSGREKGDRDFKGVYIQKTDFSGNQATATFVPMDVMFFKAKLTKKEQKRVRKGKSLGIGFPLIRYLDVTEDEDFILVVEERTLIKKTTTRTDANGNSTVSVDYDYKFENAAVFSASKDGDVNWKYIIDKYQYLSASYLQGSMFITKRNGSLYFFYNDAKNGKFTDGSKSSQLHVQRLSEKGEVMYDAQVQNRGAAIMPMHCKVIGDLVFLNGHNRKNHNVGIFDLTQ